MRKIIVLSVLIVFFSIRSMAQQTMIFTNPDVKFSQGKELFSEHKYAASYRSFEEYLKKADPTQAGQIEEASYYLAANAFELRQDDATAMLKNQLDNYPATPYLDEVNAMIGTIAFEKKDYAQALTYFNKVDEKHLGDRERGGFHV